MSLKPTLGLPTFGWRWMDGDAPDGYVALRANGLQWAASTRQGEYAVSYNGQWFSVNEAVSLGWIKPA